MEEDNKKPCNTIYSTNIMSNGSFIKRFDARLTSVFSGVITLSRKILEKEQV